MFLHLDKGVDCIFICAFGNNFGRGYMKKFSNFIICLLLCVFAFGLVGCAKDKSNGFAPKTEEAVIGNGGMVVRKGEYVYFANGFQKVSELTEDKRNSSFVKGGLYVAKLESDEFVRNDDNYLVSNNLRQISAKLAGYDATDLYVFGDYLYFVSPSNENESGKIGKSDWAKDRSVFYRVKLDNFDKVERIYTANVKHENLSFKYYFKGNKPYLLVYEKGEDLNGKGNKNMLYRVDIEAKKKKDKKASVVASNVSSVVFGYDGDDNAYDRIFYVVNNNSTYSLVRYNIASNTKTDTGIKNSSTEVEVKFVSQNYVFATRKDGSNTYMYRAEIGGAFVKMFDCNSEIVGSLHLLPNGEDLISVRDNVIQFYLRGDNRVGLNTIVDNDSESEVTAINVIGFANGSIVYYDNNNKLKIVSYSEFLAGRTATISTLATIEFNKDFLDINGGDLYYCTGDKSGYLFKIDLTNNHSNKGELVGVYLDADKPKDEE